MCCRTSHGRSTKAGNQDRIRVASAQENEASTLQTSPNSPGDACDLMRRFGNSRETLEREAGNQANMTASVEVKVPPVNDPTRRAMGQRTVYFALSKPGGAELLAIVGSWVTQCMTRVLLIISERSTVRHHVQ
jgi:hypothetical protein